MPQQILVIHGGNTFDTYEQFLEALKKETYTLEDFLSSGWRSSLQPALGEQFQVIAPKMPNADNAHYEEWKIRFENILKALAEELIIVGHSLGAIFLARYLAENKINKKIKATFLIGAPSAATANESLGDFEIADDLSGFEKQGGKIVLYHSKDDPVVPYSQTEFYTHKLPHAVLYTFEDRNHFLQSEFPELVEEIKKL